MIPLYEPDTGWKVLGMPMSQNRLSVPTWSYAMEKYPPQTIIEIGTNYGGFTACLGIHAWTIGASVHTFDVCVAPAEAIRPLCGFLPITFYNADCFEPSVISLIQQLIQRHGTTYVLCDGGNKEQEFNLFSNYLKHGDVIGAHDYSAPGGNYWPWSETHFDKVREPVLRCGLHSFMQEHFDTAGWLVFKKQ